MHVMHQSGHFSPDSVCTRGRKGMPVSRAVMAERSGAAASGAGREEEARTILIWWCCRLRYGGMRDSRSRKTPSMSMPMPDPGTIWHRQGWPAIFAATSFSS